MYINILGIIINEIYFGEKKKYLTILTIENKKISVICKGKINIQKTYILLNGMFMLLNYRDKYIFIDIHINSNFGKLICNLFAYSLSCYIIEISNKLNYNNYKEIIYLFNKLEKTNDIINFKIIKLVFELFILKQEGYLPNIKICSICSNQDIYTDYFSIKNGGTICYNCSIFNKETYNLINSTVYKCLEFIIEKKIINQALLFTANKQNINILSDLVEKYFLYYIDIKFNTLTYYNKLIFNS